MRTRIALLLLVVLAAGPARPAEEDAPPALKLVPSDLQARINRAIDSGAVALKHMQRPSGAIPYGKVPLNEGTVAFHQGTTALGLLAMIHSGVPANDPAIQRGVRWILKVGRSKSLATHHRFVYATGLVIWLLGTVDADLYRPEISALASRLARGAGSSGYWGYYLYARGAGSTDMPNMSTTQYAVLGLWEASKAGVKLPPALWVRLEKALMRGQRADGGWAYHPQGSPSTFTSSAIGLASLVIARAAVARNAKAREAIPRSREVVSALGRLGKSFDEVLKSRWTQVDTYGLFAGERAGIIAEARSFGRRDWYLEGAKKLVAIQREKGAWGQDTENRQPPAVTTAYALLFLTRATHAVVTDPHLTDPAGTAGESGGLDVSRAGKLSDKDFADLVSALLAEISGGPTPVRAIEKIESISPRVLPVLIDRLASDKEPIRRAAITALHALAGTRRGYDPAAPVKEREAAIGRWRKSLE
jgi:hypothetical protein